MLNRSIKSPANIFTLKLTIKTFILGIALPNTAKVIFIRKLNATMGAAIFRPIKNISEVALIKGSTPLKTIKPWFIGTF